MKREQKTNSFFSPAKLNLFFRVLKKRDDGFHEIASLMQAIKLGDLLFIEKAEEDHFSSTDFTLPWDERNLIVKGLKLFRQKTGLSFPVKIHLEKNIPMQAGLGGGSSNLSTTLWALSQISQKEIPVEKLKLWAGELSSDAPFFFSLGTAYSTSRGEVIKDLPPLPSASLWIAKPKGGLSTALVYQNCLSNACSCEDPSLLLSTFYKGSFAAVNDLEFSSFSLMPRLKDIKNHLKNLGFQTVLMTGSGTAFFCIGDLSSPALPNVQFTKTFFHTRSKEEWYSSN